MYIKYIYIYTDSASVQILNCFPLIGFVPPRGLYFIPQKRAQTQPRKKFNLFPQGHPLSKHIYNMYIYIYIYIDRFYMCVCFVLGSQRIGKIQKKNLKESWSIPKISFEACTPFIGSNDIYIYIFIYLFIYFIYLLNDIYIYIMYNIYI